MSPRAIYYNCKCNIRSIEKNKMSFVSDSVYLFFASRSKRSCLISLCESYTIFTHVINCIKEAEEGVTNDPQLLPSDGIKWIKRTKVGQTKRSGGQRVLKI